ncbi:MAG: helix-turn-helix transcriptional regulator [Chloroflexi bacterium]|nr:helix-turn-helix transcriptional regulator [Chloroflexota bacterium]MYF22311.1 helix-turn-helix transcriptional regulator [Chloroflexota bacterium]
MGRRQQHHYRTEPAQFPHDFAARLSDFRAAAGLSWRELARLLRVSVRTVHRWRNGARPDAGHLLSLLELATERGLLHTLAPTLAPRPWDTYSKSATSCAGASSPSSAGSDCGMRKPTRGSLKM